MKDLFYKLEEKLLSQAARKSSQEIFPASHGSLHDSIPNLLRIPKSLIVVLFDFIIERSPIKNGTCCNLQVTEIYD